MIERNRRRVVPAVAVVLTLAVALAACAAWLLWPRPDMSEDERAVRPAAPAPTTSEPRATGPCAAPAARPFVPRTISVEGVTRATEVMALPRDAAGVVGVPPVEAKDVFAWDRGGVRPGSLHGHVLLNSHTWPDGSAMGNALLRDLQEGERIVLRNGPRAACYRVTERVEVEWQAGYPGWNATDGPPQVVIVVCSGERLGPGNWTHRTLWFATPVS